MKKRLVALYIFGCLLCLFGQTAAQNPGAPLHADPGVSTALPIRFYLSSIFDEREGKDSVGTLLFSANETSVSRKIILNSLTFTGLSKILSSFAVRDTNQVAISVRIKECEIKETLSGSDRVNGVAILVLAFDLDRPSGSIPLTQYTTSAKYNRALNNVSSVEPTLRNLLGNSMKFIDKWIEAESPKNPKLAKGLKLSVSDYLVQHDDTVYYHSSRPLVWDDFREKRSDGKFAALVFPSFGYEQRTNIKDGILHVELAVKVFVVKSASWVGPGTRSNYSLKHEQRHFDLVKLVAERFKKKLLAEKLTPENYLGIINFEYLEFYREMNKIQQDYDEQTSHGSSALIQEFWNRKIEAELKLVKN